MTEFDFFFTLFGLLLGLIIAEVATKGADAIAARKRVRLGVLTPMLALFVLMDVASFWLWAWSARDLVHMTWETVYGGLFMALAYFLAAALLFPREAAKADSLDEHFWHHKRFVVGGVIVANLGPLTFQLSHLLPAWTDTAFFLWQAAYWGPLVGLWITRRRRVAIVFLVAMIGQYLLNASDLLPGSQWGDAIGLNGEAHRTAEQAAHPNPR